MVWSLFGLPSWATAPAARRMSGSDASILFIIMDRAVWKGVEMVVSGARPACAAPHRSARGKSGIIHAMKHAAKIFLLSAFAMLPMGSVRAEYGEVVFHYCYVGKP